MHGSVHAWSIHALKSQKPVDSVKRSLCLVDEAVNAEYELEDRVRMLEDDVLSRALVTNLWSSFE